jgi:DNA-binding IclR family transcriptional regulator
MTNDITARVTLDGPCRVQALDRGLAILDLLAEGPRPLAVGEIALRLGTSVPTASRLAATLRERGLLHQETRGGRYTLGLGLVRYAQGAIDGHPLELAATTVLPALVHTLGETVSLAVPSPDGPLYIHSVAPEDRVFRILISRGRILPYSVTSTGKVLLAFGPPEHVEDVIARGLPARTPRSIRDRRRFRRELQDVERLGYAVDRGESDANIGCVAVPVRARRGELAAALSCSVPIASLTADGIERMRDALEAGASDIAAAFGRATAGTVPALGSRSRH